jgi:hypothetical protein
MEGNCVQKLFLKNKIKKKKNKKKTVIKVWTLGMKIRIRMRLFEISASLKCSYHF